MSLSWQLIALMDIDAAILNFFYEPSCVVHKQYEVLRAFFVEKMAIRNIAYKFGYKPSAVSSLIRDFRAQIKNGDNNPEFFVSRYRGRKPKEQIIAIKDEIIELRKKYLSVTEIKSILDAKQYNISQRHIYNVIKQDGFERLPRRNITTRKLSYSNIKIEAPKSRMLEFMPEKFTSQNSLGILCLHHYLQSYKLDRVIDNSTYPQTGAIDRTASLLSFIALKLSSFGRYTRDDIWCMDRGLGLFSKLNVLPKAAWYTSYSHRVTRKMNQDLFRRLYQIWNEHGLLTNTANIDFTTIPYWGDHTHLENNWSGKRHKALPSILSVLAQEPDSGIITYTDTNVRHDNQSQVVLEFIDFYHANQYVKLDYLVFDSKFTTYENLARLAPDIKFLTIRRRCQSVVDELKALPHIAWTTIRVKSSSNKGRLINVHDSLVKLKGFKEKVRQIAITGHGKIKPAIIITNDMDIPVREIVHKYARRWLVEKEIAEQIAFFHLNKVSSSMVIKVDFDLTMSAFAHNLLRLFAFDLPGYTHCTSSSLYDKFLQNSGHLDIRDDEIIVSLKKKRNLPSLLNAMEKFEGQRISIFGNRKLIIEGATTS